MIAGYFSPMPPARTGVADYSAALVEALRGFGEVRVNADGDVNLYHLGNNPLHRPMYERALETPGVVVVHDAVLHHYLLGTLDRDAYIAEFTYNYGTWLADLAANLWDRRARSGIDPDYFRYAMLKRPLAQAKAVMVHNRAAARIVAEHGGQRIVEIPHLFAPPPLPPDYEVVRLRERLGIGARTFLFGVFGHLRESKRLTSVLRAFDNVVSSGCDAVLLVAGEFSSPDLARAVEPLLRRQRVVRIGYMSDMEFWRCALAIDACVNLRYPQAGETSGIAIRMMGMGKPVIFTAGDEIAAFPEAACLRVDTGSGEVEMLSDFMKWLATSPFEAQAIGSRAAAHIATCHAPARVAREVWNLLESVR